MQLLKRINIRTDMTRSWRFLYSHLCKCAKAKKRGAFIVISKTPVKNNFRYSIGSLIQRCWKHLKISSSLVRWSLRRERITINLQNPPPQNGRPAEPFILEKMAFSPLAPNSRHLRWPLVTFPQNIRAKTPTCSNLVPTERARWNFQRFPTAECTNVCSGIFGLGQTHSEL